MIKSYALTPTIRVSKTLMVSSDDANGEMAHD